MSTPRRETIMGWLLMAFGGVLVWQYTAHTAHGHALDTLVLWIAVGCIGAGGFFAHRSATRQLLAEVRKMVPFLRDGRDS